MPKVCARFANIRPQSAFCDLTPIDGRKSPCSSCPKLECVWRRGRAVEKRRFAATWRATRGNAADIMLYVLVGWVYVYVCVCLLDV